MAAVKSCPIKAKEGATTNKAKEGSEDGINSMQRETFQINIADPLGVYIAGYTRTISGS